MMEDNFQKESFEEKENANTEMQEQEKKVSYVFLRI